MSPEPTPPTLAVAIDDATCLACGCLCDDIALFAAGDRVVESRNACDFGRAWFQADHGPGDRPEAAIDGQPAARDEALARAAGILAGARAPVVTGLSGTTVEAQRVAVALADRLGAVLDPAHGAASADGLAAFQRVGRVGATLGEIRNRADVVVFWGVDPVATHPRHFERYSVEPRGRFVPEGRAGRTLLVADTHATATAAQADDFLLIVPERRFETLWTLRALVHGFDLDEGAVRDATGLPLGRLRGWAERMIGARFGAFFHGAEPGGAAATEVLLRLVRDLNDLTRFVAATLGGPGNSAGAEAVSTWQAGQPIALDFGRGVPQFRPGEASLETRLAHGQADAALIVGPGDLATLSDEARAHLGRIPKVVIAPDATATGRAATVGLASATPGIHAPGTVVRVDGAWLPLRPPLESPWPTDHQWLLAILNRLDPEGAV